MPANNCTHLTGRQLGEKKFLQVLIHSFHLRIPKNKVWLCSPLTTSVRRRHSKKQRSLACLWCHGRKGWGMCSTIYCSPQDLTFISDTSNFQHRCQLKKWAVLTTISFIFCNSWEADFLPYLCARITYYLSYTFLTQSEILAHLVTFSYCDVLVKTMTR